MNRAILSFFFLDCQEEFTIITSSIFPLFENASSFRSLGTRLGRLIGPFRWEERPNWSIIKGKIDEGEVLKVEGYCGGATLEEQPRL